MGRGRAGSLDLADAYYQILHQECINNKVLLDSTGNCIQAPGAKCNRKSYEEEDPCV